MAGTDKPLIDSLLDVDFYKDTMGQAIFHRHRTVPVKLAFKNRHTHVRLAECLDLAQLRENLDHLRTLRFRREELRYLNQNMCQPDYLEYLRTLRLPEYHLDQRDGQLVLEFAGEWAAVTRWETLALQVVAELYAQGHEQELARKEGLERLTAKIKVLKANPRIIFSDFGTRRRFSRRWQEEVVSRLVGNPQFLGTSNTQLAMKYGLTPMGTNAHELPMVYSAIYRNEDEAARRLVSSRRVLEEWEEEYGLALSIFLPDTYGSDYFYSKVVSPRMLERWKGSRHDSGDPKEYGDKCIARYQAAGIDPTKKLIVFADGLDAPLIDNLERYFRGRIQTSFGIGTNLTNDLGPAPLSIVVKPVEANGLPVVKLSDNIEKATGDAREIDRMKRLVGYSVKFAAACRY
jgi:nicotinate phosphoribosyltransferase